MNQGTAKTNHLKWILPLLILGLAIFGAILTVKSAKAPEKKPQLNPGLRVETVSVVRKLESARVRAMGTTAPLQEISLVTEVSGKVTWLSAGFSEGGFFRKGEKLLEIDPRDYHLAIQKAEADLARARTGLQTEMELSGIAKREWDQIQLPDKGTPGALVLRQPQFESAQADLAAAQAALEQAKLNLERTSIFAPFNGRLRSKKVDLGEYVRSGNALAAFAGTDAAEIIVPLPVEDLHWLDIPAACSANKGSTCIISAQIGNSQHQWQGYISRTFGEIDSASRMAKIAVQVNDPYNLMQKKSDPDIRLANGMFVTIEIVGRNLGEVAEIPRSALREGGVVWLSDKNNQLEIRPIQILLRQQENLLIDQGLQGGEQLILTNISGAAKGLKLRPQPKEMPQ